jgi:hypothetical protein
MGEEHSKEMAGLISFISRSGKARSSCVIDWTLRSTRCFGRVAKGVLSLCTRFCYLLSSSPMHMLDTESYTLGGLRASHISYIARI